jgi:hypothetical protein
MRVARVSDLVLVAGIRYELAVTGQPVAVVFGAQCAGNELVALQDFAFASKSAES